jgi:hypothetical protein
MQKSYIIEIKNPKFVTLVPEVYFSSALRNENNKNKPLDPGYKFVGLSI